MRVLMVAVWAVFVAGCFDSEATGVPREVCGDGIDNDGDSFADNADQDCWIDGGAAVTDGGAAVADSGPAPAVDAGIVPAVDGGSVMPPVLSCAAGFTRVRISWQSDVAVRYAQIQGCWESPAPGLGGVHCVVDRLTGMDGACATDTGTVVCRLDRVPVGSQLDFNAYGELSDGSAIWGVGRNADGSTVNRGGLMVSEDRNCDGMWELDRISGVRVVGLSSGAVGANYSFLPGR